ncbi:MAG: alanine racemase [Actinomycetota bacterium]|nr:alanine racemase [Actinomycetota bacterium]
MLRSKRSEIDMDALVGTPYLLIDGARMERNIRGMADVARRAGVSLRPHIKTHKSPFIAKKQLEAGAVGITAAKVSEAEVMVDAGIRDVFIAYPVVTEPRVQQAIELSKRTDLTVGVDSLEGAKRLAEAAREEDVALDVRLEIDTGLRRTGVPYDDAVKVAYQIDRLQGLNLTGIYTYRGAVLGGSKTLDLKAAGEEEGKLMVSLADRIREQGVGVEDVSVGSTPTVEYVAEVEGVTEIRPGTYVFYDRMQDRLDACSIEDCAATVITSIVSRPHEDVAMIDGGSKTFATDVLPDEPPINLRGYGQVMGSPEIVLESLWEEHGRLAVSGEHDFGVGDRVQIVPNHICSTVNLHNKVYLLNEDSTVQALEVAARGKVR